jgi:hypothetical protein
MNLIHALQKHKFQFVIGIVLAICVTTGHHYFSNLIFKDICLDKGGSWNDSSQMCDQ